MRLAAAVTVDLWHLPPASGCPRITAVLGALALAACAGTPVAVKQADVARQTRRALHDIVKADGAVGISYAVVSGDSTVFAGSSGRMDAGRGATVSDSTLYMAYSVTKALTAIVVMQLVESGRMELDAPLSRYFSDHPYGDGVTIRGLLAHTGGVPNPMPLDWFSLEGEPVDSRAALARVLVDNDTLAAEPGAEYGYSNVGYWLLEMAIEGATGDSYVDVAQRQVFAPLGITADGASFELPPADRLATGHIRRWSLTNMVLYVTAPSRYWSTRRGGWSRFVRLRSHGFAYGGLYTTATAFSAVLSDLLRDDSRLLSSASRKVLFAAHRTSGGAAVGGCLGWVLGELDGVPYIGKQGGGAGFHGNVRLYPSVGLAIVFFANSTEISPSPIDARSDALDAPFLRGRARR